MGDRHEAFELVIFFSLLVISYLFIGPFIHEITHMAFLDQLGCFYETEWVFSVLTGLKASVQPYCALENPVLLGFYASGYLSVIVLGGLLAFWSLEFQDLDSVRGVFTGSLGAGLLLSTGIAMTVRGDIMNSLSVFDISPLYGLLISFFVLLGASATAFKLLVHIFDRSEWEE